MSSLCLFLILAMFTLLYCIPAHEYVQDQHGEGSLDVGFVVKLFDGMLNRLETRLETRFDKMEARLETLETGLKTIETRLKAVENSMMTKKEMQALLINQHDFNRNKMKGLKQISGYSSICDSFITTHYVVYNKKMFGISVAHTPCFVGDSIPEFVLPVPNLDVSIWSGVPPPSVSLLNITDRIVSAEIGDTATAFGLTMNGWPRAWQGMLVGMLNVEEQGRHFTNHAHHHKEELLFQGAQSGGMSGGAVLNGNG